MKKKSKLRNSKQTKKASWFSSISTPMKVIGGSLLAALLGVLWWWLGISIRELDTIWLNTPIRVYNPSIMSYRDRNAAFHYALSPELDLAKLTGKKNTEIMGKIEKAETPATLDGSFEIIFDIESAVEVYQVNIESIDLEIVYSPLLGATNIEETIPGLGGGGYRDYRVKLTPENGKRISDNTTIYPATLDILNNSEKIDYIYVRPGERETIRVSGVLDKTGNFSITPLINYAYKDKKGTLRAETLRIVYPQKYQYWYWNIDPDGMTQSFQGSDIILDTQSNFIGLLNPQSQPSQIPLAKEKWIVFETLVSAGDTRYFVIDTNGEHLTLLSQWGTNVENIDWLPDGRLYFETVSYVIENDIAIPKVFDPATMLVSEADESAKQSISQHIYSNCITASECVESYTEDTNGDGKRDYNDKTHIYLVDNQDTPIKQIGFSQYNQTYVSLSSNKDWVAFVDGERLCGESRKDPQAIFAMLIDGSNLKRVSYSAGWYRDLFWSPNGRLIAFASYRPTPPNDYIDCLSGPSLPFNAYVMDVETGTEIQLTSDGGYDISGWTSDNNWVLLSGEKLSFVKRDGSYIYDIFFPFVDIVRFDDYSEVSFALLQP